AAGGEGTWYEEQSAWYATPAPELHLTAIAGHPSSPNRLEALVDLRAAVGSQGPGAEFQGDEGITGQRPAARADDAPPGTGTPNRARRGTRAGHPAPAPLALELVRRDGEWWVARPAPLWAGGSPLQLRLEDRAALAWLRYPLRVAPLPADLALMQQLAE